MGLFDAYIQISKGVRYNWDYEDRYVYEYGANGQVAQLTNTDILTVTTSEHDAAGRPARITRKHLDTGAHLYTGEVSYDEFNNLKTFKEQVGSDHAAYTTTFTHDNENRPTQLNFGSSRQVAYVYDGLGRISRRTVNAGSTGVATTYGYLAGGHGTNSTTPLVQTITQSGTTLTYAYDNAGNITSVSDGSKTISYEYDLLGQLTRVNDPYDTTAGTSGTTWKYAYDQGGNIQSKTAYAFTTGTVGSAVKTDSFTYGDTNWKDKLTAFNGQTITYDAIGNPTNDGTWNYTWYGRQMRAIHKGEFGEQGYDEITFEYNENGLRTKKTRMYYDDATGDIGYKATNYTLHGKNIVHLSDGSNNLHFFYDAQNKPAVVIFNGTAYAYLYNLQGDVIGLVDSNGTKMVSYTYDAWGKMLSKTGTLASTLGTIQPFRYRGYVYDEETGLYYLRSRFYLPTYSRFINTDNLMGYSTALFGHNIMVYCSNSPILYSDQNGHWPSYNPILNYGLYKPFYSGLAYLFLSAKGWSVTNELFQHGIWGGGKDFSTNKSGTNKLSQAIANSPDTKAFLGDYAKDMEPGSSKEISGGYEYKNGDLYYALQHVTYAGVITKDAAGNWSATITITDKFNFDAERLDWSSAEAFISSISLGNVANDGGLALQNLRILDPYKIVVDVTVCE